MRLATRANQCSTIIDDALDANELLLLFSATSLLGPKALALKNLKYSSAILPLNMAGYLGPHYSDRQHLVSDLRHFITATLSISSLLLFRCIGAWTTHDMES
jgi:hypothetical protein